MEGNMSVGEFVSAAAAVIAVVGVFVTFGAVVVKDALGASDERKAFGAQKARKELRESAIAAMRANPVRNNGMFGWMTQAARRK